MVGVAVIAVFACALFLVPNASAQIEIVDYGVEPPIGDVRGEFTYYVNLSYKYRISLPGEVELTYGPNLDNMDCHDPPEQKSFFFQPGENKNITFERIQLEPLKRCDGKFKNFTERKKGWKWDKCWYKFKIKIPFLEFEKEIWGWEPILTIIWWELRDEEVDPPTGTNEDRFTYSVRINASKESPVELLVYNYSSRDFEFKEAVMYEKPLHWRRIEFEDIELSPSELSLENDSKYIFRYRGNNETSSEFSGPFWPINVSWKNESVNPDEGLYTFSFNYSVRVNATKEGEVKLIPYYPNLGEATIDERADEPTREYTDVGNWTTFYWNVTPFKKRDEGTATYKFEFLYNEVKINETESYKGPEIGIAEFKNNSVEPEIGTRETEFTYRVEVRTVPGESDKLYLKVYDSGGNLIREKKSDKKTSPNWELFEFKNVTFIYDPPAELGTASYEFKVKGTTRSYDDPELIEEEFKNAKVSPEKGTNETSFNFNVDVKASKNEIIELLVSCDDRPWEVIGSENYTKDGWETLNFTNITLSSFNLSFNTSANFTFKGIVNKSRNISIPYDINLSWRNNYSYPPEGWCNETFNYSIDVKAERNGTVELQIESKGDCEKGERQTYNKTSEWQTMNWTITNPCGEYEGNTSYKFVFYLEGKKNNETAPYTGPKLFIPINISFTEDFAEPNYGVYYNFKDGIFNDTNNTLFNFSINVTADKNTTIKLVLIDPDDNKHEIEEKCEYKTHKTPGQPQECSWRMIEPPSGQAGKWNYTFSYYDTRLYYDTGDGWNMSNKTFEGPEIIAVFENYTLDPESCPFGDPCNVTVCMKGTEEMNVTLEAFNLWPDHKNWTIIEPLKQYEPPGEECLNWTIDTFKVPFDKLRLIWKVI